MTRMLRGEKIIQKFKFDELNPTLKGNVVPFFLMGSPSDSNENVQLPFIEMKWTPGPSRAMSTDAKTFRYDGLLVFYIFMPKGLNPYEAVEVVSQIEEKTTHKFKDYPEGTVSFGAARTRPTRTVDNSEMTVFEVETVLLLR